MRCNYIEPDVEVVAETREEAIAKAEEAVRNGIRSEELDLEIDTYVYDDSVEMLGDEGVVEYVIGPGQLQLNGNEVRVAREVVVPLPIDISVVE